MSDDEQAIRDLIDNWQRATTAGDIPKVLGLMTDDAVFMVAGRAPFGKKEFEASAQAMQGVRIEGRSEIVELKVVGTWAWCRTYLELNVTPKTGSPMRRSGHSLTILCKQADGAWLLARDANLLNAE